MISKLSTRSLVTLYVGQDAETEEDKKFSTAVGDELVSRGLVTHTADGNVWDWSKIPVEEVKELEDFFRDHGEDLLLMGMRKFLAPS